MNREIGQRLRASRLLRGMTLEEVAVALGVRYQMIYKYEKGTVNITPAKLKTLARIVGVPIAHFFKERNSEKTDIALFGRRLTSLVRRLAEIERHEPDRFYAICRMAGIQTPKCRFYR